MQKIILICAAALTLAGCNTIRGQYAGTGALVGGTTGAIIGGVSSGTGGGALAGGAIGAAAGALIGAAIAPDTCYARKRNGRLVRVRC